MEGQHHQKPALLKGQQYNDLVRFKKKNGKGYSMKRLINRNLE